MHPRTCRTAFTPCRTAAPEGAPSGALNSSSRPTSRGGQAHVYCSSSPTDTKSTLGDSGKNRMPSDKSRGSITCLSIPGFNSRESFPCAYIKLTSRYAHQANIDNTNASAGTIKRLGGRLTFSILAGPAICGVTEHLGDARVVCGLEMPSAWHVFQVLFLESDGRSDFKGGTVPSGTVSGGFVGAL